MNSGCLPSLLCELEVNRSNFALLFDEAVQLFEAGDFQGHDEQFSLNLHRIRLSAA
jgi:hypothetical protein